MTAPLKSCHWVRDKDVPGGRFLVPGCWNRTLYGDDADCQCETRRNSLADLYAAAMRRIDDLEERLAALEDQ